MLVLFPNQLFATVAGLGGRYGTIYLVEDPLYFYDADERPLRYNKLKLAYMVASMRWYADWLRSQGTRVRLIEYDRVQTGFYDRILRRGKQDVYMYDPVDHAVMARYRELCGARLRVLDTPAFLMTSADLAAYWDAHGAGGKNQQHATFFEFVRARLGVLEGVASTDRDNRRPFPRGFKGVPGYVAPDHGTGTGTGTDTYYDAAARYVEKHFPHNIGSTAELRRYPITHADSEAALDAFVRDRLSEFAPYEDAMAANAEDPVLYHSGLSAQLNMGLLSPRMVLDRVMASGGGPARLEGFVRQVAGWREYMRYLYVYFRPGEDGGANALGNTRRIRDWAPFYEGRLGLEPFDTEVRKALRFGYAHHIVRLMIFLNVFLLLEIDPRDVYRWFMEVVAMDAWDWVMKANVYMMGWYGAVQKKGAAVHGLKRPYVSSSAYVLKMSQYPRGDWCGVWDALFYRFLVRKRGLLVGSAAVYMRNLAAFMKRPAADRERVLALAEGISSCLN